MYLNLPHEEDTYKLGKHLAHTLKPQSIIALFGDLGTGKTTLARAIIQARMGHNVEVASPTFSLVQTYDTPGLRLLHADLYRLDTWADIRELNLEEALENAALIVEWADKLGTRLATLSPNRLELFFISSANDGRQVEAKGYGSWSNFQLSL